MAILMGDSLNNMLNGTNFADTVFGYGGNDRINGLNGNDVLFGDFGYADTGPGGNDTIDGGRGNDYIDGGYGNDSLAGGNDSDLIGGGYGDDTISGGSGSDGAIGGYGNDRINGDNGSDFVDGGEGNDTVNGGGDNDGVAGGEGYDSVDGGSGHDVVSGGGLTSYYGGMEQLPLIQVGGEGFAIQTTPTNDVPSFVIGFDDGYADLVSGGSGNDTLFGSFDSYGYYGSTDTLVGGSGDDMLVGAGEGNIFDGGAGSKDTLVLTDSASSLGGPDDVSALDARVTGVEILDISQNGNCDNLAIEDSSFVEAFTDKNKGTLRIIAGSDDQITLDGENWTANGTQTINGQLYDRFVSIDKATLLVTHDAAIISV